MADITLDQIKAMANRGTGLVPMRVNRNFAPYFKGTVHGFTPQHALAHWKNGDAVFLKRPDLRPAESVRRDPQQVQNDTPAAEVVTKIEADAVEIPGDWDMEGRGQGVRRIAIASRISGRTGAEVGNDDNAKAIIAAELERRSAAV